MRQILVLRVVTLVQAINTPEVVFALLLALALELLLTLIQESLAQQVGRRVQRIAAEGHKHSLTILLGVVLIPAPRHATRKPPKVAVLFVVYLARPVVQKHAKLTIHGILAFLTVLQPAVLILAYVLHAIVTIFKFASA